MIHAKNLLFVHWMNASRKQPLIHLSIRFILILPFCIFAFIKMINVSWGHHVRPSVRVLFFFNHRTDFLQIWRDGSSRSSAILFFSKYLLPRLFTGTTDPIDPKNSTPAFALLFFTHQIPFWTQNSSFFLVCVAVYFVLNHLAVSFQKIQLLLIPSEFRHRIVPLKSSLY